MFIKLAEASEIELISGCRVRFVHTENMTMAYFTFDEGASIPEHSHLHEQITNVIDGEFELTVDGKTEVLRRGMAAVIPPHVKHSGRALSACTLMDVFHPVREDYRTLTEV